MLHQTEICMAFSAVCMLVLSACHSDDVPYLPDHPGKTPIELTSGLTDQAPAVTRAVTPDNPTQSQPFTTGTSLYMVMKSDAPGAESLYTRTIGYTQPGDAASTVAFADGYKRFWEDSYSRSSQLTVYSACVPGYYLEGTESLSPNASATGTADSQWTIGDSDEYPNHWATTYGVATLAWPLRHGTAATQTADFLSSQDLCFSNNVTRVAFKGGRFDSGHLVFCHALTRVTFIINKGDGFEEDEPFRFPTGENIRLTHFNTAGTFDIAQGQFTAVSAATPVAALAVTTDRSTTSRQGAYVLDGLLVPGTSLDDATKGDITFTINNNQYQLTKADLKKALEPTSGALDAENKMRAGVHYTFTMTVGKKKLDRLTASLVDWATVTADAMTPSNARILVTLLASGGTTVDYHQLNLYRSENRNTGSTIDDDFQSFGWATGYNSKANLVKNTASTTVYEAKTEDNAAWYWTDNNTFYHFRTVMPKTDDAWTVETADGNDYITLTAAAAYKDVCWGAPFTTSTTPDYDPETHGYDGSPAHQISKAIGPTEGTISIVMFHMMSDVTIELTTTTGDDQVVLDGAKLEMSGVHATARVMMGNGLVVPTETPTTVSHTLGTADTPLWHYGFVPQSLANVKLTITTTDHNQYVIDMQDIRSGTAAIGRWLPNHKYTYTFKLTKAGIAKMTATLANWEEVSAGDDNVQIR